MSLRVYIFGESGRMGQEIRRIVENTPGLEPAGGFSAQNPSLAVDQAPDLVIDFSLPETLPQLVEFVSEHRCAVASGTTGYTENDFGTLRSLSQKAPIFWSANMSFGVYLMCQLTEVLARFEKFYDFSIEETHHVHKKDKPSGTALIVEKAARRSTQQLAPIVSLREGEIFGIHRFIARSKNEELEIRHTAHNRTLFAQGAVEIGQWLVNQPAGYYGMDDFFKNFQSE